MKDYLNVATANDLKGGERALYRALEIMPGLLSWGTLLGAVFLSWQAPIWAAFFIIIFDVYWLVKTAYLSAHLRSNWRRLKHNLAIDWQEKMEHLKYDDIWQLVLLPMYKEGSEVVESTIDKILESKWPKSRMIITLAIEERAGDEARKTADLIKEKYGSHFGHFLTTIHPANVSGELAGKGSNIAYAARETRRLIVDAKHIPYENILVSAFDIDTQVYPQYFMCLAYHFLTADNPHRSSYQPVPVYNNNIWDVSALSRVVATSGTFWQMMQQERPERLATFSSHSMSFKALDEAGYWPVNMVSEDSRIFWKSLLRFDGNYEVVPLSYPVSMDANVGANLWQTAKNVYKQQRRWSWGVENLPYLMYGSIKNKVMPWGKKLRLILTQLEGFWSLPTNPLLIFMLGWLPLMLGGDEFNTTLLSYNLPRITRTLMTIAMSGLIFSAALSTWLLPPRPAHVGRRAYLWMILQWLLIPFTITILGAIPGLDAQTRLMFGKYMGFWVTPKERPKAE